ncbi:MAG: heme exporter protein CcmD [Burkholderiales bacterium]
MKWQSIEHFLSMGGYGLYVWGSYGATIVVALVEIALLRKRVRSALKRASDGSSRSET